MILILFLILVPGPRARDSFLWGGQRFGVCFCSFSLAGLDPSELRIRRPWATLAAWDLACAVRSARSLADPLLVLLMTKVNSLIV